MVVFNEEGQFLRRIGCDSITNFPNGIDISDAGDVLVGDSHGNRFHVAVFSRDGSLLSEFECPYVKVNVILIIVYVDDFSVANERILVCVILNSIQFSFSHFQCVKMDPLYSGPPGVLSLDQGEFTGVPHLPCFQFSSCLF